MALEEELVDWAGSRPAWQQEVLVRLAHGENITDADVAKIASDLIGGRSAARSHLAVTDLPGGGVAGETVTLASIQPVEHVNALQDGEVLTFSDHGLTVVYGDNASGKSGYARLLKQLDRARHRERILSDIFKDRSTDVPSATVHYSVDGTAHEDEWPGDTSPVLGQVTFYDEECGNTYISTESAVTYRPSALGILDGLITVCDAVKTNLDQLTAANTQQRVSFPVLPDGTAGKHFLDTLSARTTQEQIDEACAVPDCVDQEITQLAEEESR